MAARFGVEAYVCVGVFEAFGLGRPVAQNAQESREWRPDHRADHRAGGVKKGAGNAEKGR